MKKWITCPDLCSRWDCGISDIADIVNDGKLRSYEKNRLEICMYGDGYYVTYKDGSSAFSQEPLTDDHVAELIFHISDVKEYEKKNGITPLTLLTDDHCDETPLTTRKENADDTPQKNRIDTPLFDRQVWEEVVRLYEILLEIGFDGPGIEEKLKSAAKKELAQNRKHYQLIKQKHLNKSKLFALNPGQERRDFIGNLLQIVVKKNDKKTIGAQKLYQYGKQNYSK